MLSFNYSRFWKPRMSEKSHKKQSLRRRKPIQERAQEKIELILEAATRIIDKDGLEGLTTNRIAEVAGISIGTLYQYFGDKAAIIDVLGQREMKTVTDSIITTLATSISGAPQEPARVLINCVFSAFGGRSRVHRVLLEHAWQMGRASSVDASPKLIANLLSSSGVSRSDGQTLRLSPEEAFVLTHAFTGVIRASIGPHANDLSREEIKSALLTLIGSFVNAKKTSDSPRPEK
jgi:AcrR family transcriptional regulator